MITTIKSEDNIASGIQSVRRLLIIVIAGLIFSGVTAFPIESELEIGSKMFSPDSFLGAWLGRVYEGVRQTNLQYPFIAYGTDWLAFAHLIIALLFAGCLKDPVANKWVIQWGLIACISIVPLAMIAGNIREIPFLWRLLDCSFGLVGGLILWRCHRVVVLLEQRQR